MGDVFEKDTQRVIEESVPGKQVTMAHVVASPVSDIYDRLGIDEAGAIGILAISPYETAIIAADIATKAADVSVVFLDRFNGSLVINGDVASVESGVREVLNVLSDMMGFAPAPITRS